MRVSMIVLIAIFPGAVQAQCGTSSLTTTFAAGAVAGPGSGAFFDLTVTSANGINICGFDVHSSTTPLYTVFTVDAYLKPNTYAGADATPSAWRLAGTAVGTAPGPFAPAITWLTDPIYLPAGSWGMALYQNGASVGYTPGTASNQSYGNSTLLLNAGIVRTTLFGIPPGAVMTPAVWNGAIHYEVCSPTSGAGFGFLGAGCAGALPVSRIRALTLPRRGSFFSVSIDKLPQNQAVLMLGLSRTTSVYGALPLSLAPFGAPGCVGFVSPDLTVPLAGTGNQAAFGFGIPDDPALQCAIFYLQALVIDAAANAAGFVVSDAAAALIGV